MDKGFSPKFARENIILIESLKTRLLGETLMRYIEQSAFFQNKHN